MDERSSVTGEAEPADVVVERRHDRNLAVAVGVGVLLAALFLGSLFLHPFAFTLVVLAFGLLAAVETSAVLSELEPAVPVARPVLVVGIAALLLGAYALGSQGQVLGMLVLVLGGFAWNLALRPRRDVVAKLGTTLLLGCWIGLFASYGVLLARQPQDPEVAVLAVVGAAIVGDIGAYAVGRSIGRTRIAPTVSPNKTVEGLLGGLVLAGALGWLVLPRLGELFADPAVAALVAVVSALAGFVGDLAESMVKRDLHVKDLGSLLPGHGGVLDRVDGLLFALPVGYHALDLLV